MEIGVVEWRFFDFRDRQDTLLIAVQMFVIGHVCLSPPPCSHRSRDQDHNQLDNILCR
jgi:hypothetical protein